MNTKDLAIGAAAGFAATGPMTWSMEMLHRRLPDHEQDPLPPREITERVAEEVGVKQELDEPGRFWLTLASHFCYGSAAGALYGPLRGTLPVPPPVEGAAYGLAVWAGSYLGLLPALGILAPATHHPARRNGLMIAAHLVWGASLGAFADALAQAAEGDGLQSMGSKSGNGRTHEYNR